MAEKVRYPQIPGTVWWGVRGILNKTPNTTLDERVLAIQLGVQEAAAKQYIAELIPIGILNEDKKATPLARKWRLDDTYGEAVSQILESAYPQALRDLAPPSEGDRKKAVSWFLQEGLGQGSAGNRAATYFMIGSPTPNESPIRRQDKQSVPAKAGPSLDKSVTIKKRAPSTPARQNGDAGSNPSSDGIPLNVNVQIHISADATSEQIESIFSAMRRYLYDKQAS
jgi:hypothetical protein